MEKFNKWRDPATGIHPFLPASPPKGTVKYVLLGPVVATVRFVLLLPLLAVFVACWLVCQTLRLLAPLIPRLVCRVLERLTCAPIARLMLLVLGFHQIDSEWGSVRKGKLPPAAALPWPIGATIKRGDFIVCNHSSYVDILYLYFRFSPVFTRITADGRQLVPVSLFQAIRDAVSPPSASAPSTLAMSPLALSQWAAANLLGPVIVMPEQTTSNGRGLLHMQFPAPDEGAGLPVPIHFVGLRYYYGDFSPSYTCGSLTAHFYRLCCQWNNTLNVRFLLPSENPFGSGGGIPAGQDPAALSTTIADILAQLMRLRRTQQSLATKRAFLDEFSHKQQKRAYFNKAD